MVSTTKSVLEQVPSVDLQNQAITPERLNGRVTLLITARRSCVDAANEMAKAILCDFGNHNQFACLMVADLSTLPRISWSIAKTIMHDRSRRARKELEILISRAGKQYSPPQCWLYVPDWEGELTLALFKQSLHSKYASFNQDISSLSGVEQNCLEREQQYLRNQLQSFILNRNGEMIAHYTGEDITCQVIYQLRAMLSLDPFQ